MNKRSGPPPRPDKDIIVSSGVHSAGGVNLGNLYELIAQRVREYKRHLHLAEDEPLAPVEPIESSLDGLVCPVCDGVFDEHEVGCANKEQPTLF